jgi:predicted RNase H-like nuclease (RuvC/YqgF family)
MKKLREENKKLKLENADLMWERDGLKIAVEKLKEENQTLELWLDNKEKLNEEYRKQIDKYKRQYQRSMWFSDFWWYDE